MSCVYRFYNEDWQPIYTGVSQYFWQRLKAHQKKPWWPEVAHIVLDDDYAPHDGRIPHGRAYLDEQRLIKTESPRENRTIRRVKHGQQ